MCDEQERDEEQQWNDMPGDLVDVILLHAEAVNRLRYQVCMMAKALERIADNMGD